MAYSQSKYAKCKAALPDGFSLSWDIQAKMLRCYRDLDDGSGRTLAFSRSEMEAGQWTNPARVVHSILSYHYPELRANSAATKSVEKPTTPGGGSET